jgi:hypothetical protein
MLLCSSFRMHTENTDTSLHRQHSQSSGIYHASAFLNRGGIHCSPKRLNTSCSFFGKNALESRRRVLMPILISQPVRVARQVTYMPALSNFIPLWCWLRNTSWHGFWMRSLLVFGPEPEVPFKHGGASPAKYWVNKLGFYLTALFHALWNPL